jgi:hypothetical protein
LVESHYTRAVTARRYICQVGGELADEVPETFHKMLDAWIGSKKELYKYAIFTHEVHFK